ncbi:MAG TPA: hypothetical protein VF291_10175 [Burkholderiaceae bacterium]
MLEILIAAAIGGYAAPECEVAFERFEETRTILRVRPACPIGFASTQTAVRQILQQAGDATVVTLSLGRIERYPWLSDALARQASSSRRWDATAGRPVAGHANTYVAAALRGMPEFTVLFERWQVAGVSVEKVLWKRAAELQLPAGAPVSPRAKLPYDAILWVTLQRP